MYTNYGVVLSNYLIKYFNRYMTNETKHFKKFLFDIACNTFLAQKYENVIRISSN